MSWIYSFKIWSVVDRSGQDIGSLDHWSDRSIYKKFKIFDLNFKTIKFNKKNSIKNIDKIHAFVKTKLTRNIKLTIFYHPKNFINTFIKNTMLYWYMIDKKIK